MFEEAKESAARDLESLSLNEQQKADRKAFIQGQDLAIADALVVQRSYAQAREVLLQSSAEQAPSILALLDEDPESYRKSVLDAPIG
jgi:hypothetical protein